MDKSLVIMVVACVFCLMGGIVIGYMLVMPAYAECQDLTVKGADLLCGCVEQPELFAVPEMYELCDTYAEERGELVFE